VRQKSAVWVGCPCILPGGLHNSGVFEAPTLFNARAMPLDSVALSADYTQLCVTCTRETKAEV
jgi:hypothetical protein